MTCKFVLALLMLTSAAHAQSTKETDWQPPLAESGAPDCPQHTGHRVSYSEMAAMGTVSARIVWTADRNANGECSSRVNLVLHSATERVIPLATPGSDYYAIADFSPDGHSFLLVLDKAHAPPEWKQTRDLDVAVIDVAHPRIQRTDVWDLFGWDDCEATVEPQGFTQDGRVLILARPSTSAGEVRHDCVRNWELYATDMKSTPIRLPDDFKVSRFGKETADKQQACKSDPDIVEACFTIRGDLRVWNGSPSLRIWQVGTKRILGVSDDFPLPEELDRFDLLNGELWGDFQVCPFAKDRPGVMRPVCVESASRLTYKRY
jgi:hypothetical protein